MIIVNGWKLLTVITKSSTLGVAAVKDPPLLLAQTQRWKYQNNVLFFKLTIKAPERRYRRDSGVCLVNSEQI